MRPRSHARCLARSLVPPAAPAVLVVLVVLAGCGSTSVTSAERPSGSSGTTTVTTPGALAWLAAQHLGDPDTAARSDGWTYRLVRGAVGADLRYGAGPGEDGDLLSVVVSPGATEGLTCTTGDRIGGGCVSTHAATIHWRRTVPGQESGSITVYAARGGATVRVHASLDLRGDPRTRVEEPGLDDLVDLATDPRVGLTTTTAAAAGSGRLTYWDDWNGPAGSL